MHRLLAKSWHEMARWERMVFVLYHRGPHTTGALGHIYGIGQNVRGIRREACHALQGSGWTVESRKLAGESYHTYRLVNVALRPHLARTKRVVAAISGNARVPVTAGKQGGLFDD